MIVRLVAGVTLAAVLGCKQPTPEPDRGEKPVSGSASAGSPLDAAVVRREPGSFAILVPITEIEPRGSLVLPVPFVYEHAGVDAVLRGGQPANVSEVWKAADAGCLHRYTVVLRGASDLQQRVDDLATAVGGAVERDEDELRLRVDAPRAGMPFVLTVQTLLDEPMIVVEIDHTSVAPAACVSAAIQALPLRWTTELASLGAVPRVASFVRNEASLPNAYVEWLHRRDLADEVRAWVSKRSRAIGTGGEVTFEDGGGGHLTDITASFFTRRN